MLIDNELGSYLFEHEGELHAVFGNVFCVQEAVELKVKLPAGVLFVCAG